MFAVVPVRVKQAKQGDFKPVVLAKDTPTRENEETDAADPHQTGSGSAASPGGADAPNHSSQNLTHGESEYPGPRADGETEKTKETPRDNERQ